MSSECGTTSISAGSVLDMVGDPVPLGAKNIYFWKKEIKHISF